MENQLLANLFFSFNAVMPVFLMVLIGVYLKHKKVLNEQFSTGSNRLVFTIALPAMIFESIYSADFKNIFDPKLISFSIIGTLLLTIIVSIAAFFFLSEKKAFGSFVQGSFRSNFVIIGIPLIKNLSDTLGSSAVSKSAIIISFIMPLYNILAVIILSSSSTDKTADWHKNLLKNIAKNPLIIAVILALPFSIFNIHLPVLLEKTISYLSAIAVPLALIDIGANFNLIGFLGNIKLAAIASFIKIALSPLVLTYGAFLLGFRGTDIGVLYILFASPTAISSYIMAKGMKNDAALAGNIVLISTIGSIITLFLGIFILKSFGLIYPTN